MTFVFALLASALAGEGGDRPVGFTEVVGGWGFQLGTTPYIPRGDGFNHPLTNGPSVGAGAGLALTDTLFVVGDYSFTQARSVHGEIPGAVDEIEAGIHYQTVTAGLRSVCGHGPGRVYGEMTAGVLLPFDTEVRYTYNERLAPEPVGISGVGTKRDEYNAGYGAQASMGYQRLLGDRFYVSGLLKVRAFTTSNVDRKTTLDNFVTDWTALPPAAVDATTTYETDGENQPSTYSVQDGRVYLSVGAYF
jgi:hypothetical protein